MDGVKQTLRLPPTFHKWRDKVYLYVVLTGASRLQPIYYFLSVVRSNLFFSWLIALTTFPSWSIILHFWNRVESYDVETRRRGILLENCKGIRDDRVRYLFRSSHILLRKATILHVIQQHPFQRVDVMLEEKVLLLFHTWHHFPQKVHVPLFLTLC